MDEKKPRSLGISESEEKKSEGGADAFNGRSKTRVILN